MAMASHARVEKWLLREFGRASARYDKLPEYARPIVTRPVMSSRRSPSNAPQRKDATPESPAHGSNLGRCD